MTRQARELARSIEKARKKLGSYQKVAGALGVPRTTLYRWRKGQVKTFSIRQADNTAIIKNEILPKKELTKAYQGEIAKQAYLKTYYPHAPLLVKLIVWRRLDLEFSKNGIYNKLAVDIIQGDIDGELYLIDEYFYPGFNQKLVGKIFFRYIIHRKDKDKVSSYETGFQSRVTGFLTYLDILTGKIVRLIQEAHEDFSPEKVDKSVVNKVGLFAVKPLDEKEKTGTLWNIIGSGEIVSVSLILDTVHVKIIQSLN